MWSRLKKLKRLPLAGQGYEIVANFSERLAALLRPFCSLVASFIAVTRPDRYFRFSPLNFFSDRHITTTPPYLPPIHVTPSATDTMPLPRYTATHIIKGEPKDDITLATFEGYDGHTVLYKNKLTAFETSGTFVLSSKKTELRIEPVLLVIEGVEEAMALGE